MSHQVKGWPEEASPKALGVEGQPWTCEWDGARARDGMVYGMLAAGMVGCLG